MAVLIAPRGSVEDLTYVSQIQIEKDVKKDLHAALTMNMKDYVEILHNMVTTSKYKGKEVPASLVVSSIGKLLEIQKNLSTDIIAAEKLESLPKDVIESTASTRMPITSADEKKNKALTNKVYDKGLPEGSVSTYYLAETNGVPPEFLYPLRMQVSEGQINHLEMMKLIKAERERLENGG